MISDAHEQLQIVHLGLGAFHRAHQAWYLQRLHDANDRTWSIVAGNLRAEGEAVIDALRHDEGAYVLETIDPRGIRNYESIKVIRQVLPCLHHSDALLAAAAESKTRIISFTVTEAGYYLDHNHALDLHHEVIRADLQALRGAGVGVSLYAALVRMLRLRVSNGAGPVTLLCCDNLRHNGDRSRAALLAFIDSLGDLPLRQWVESQATHPNTMVDRITPRVSPDIGERVAMATGANGLTAVMSESFRQWIIEDQFINGRPAWQHVGAQMVESVVPYEEAKIRLLNATHSCIAWAGALAGHEFIHEAALDPAIRRLAWAYATEDVIPVLEPSPVDLAAYRDSVLERFTNPAIRDTIARVASDSFAKIPGFVAPTIVDRLRRGESLNGVAALPALFLMFLQHWQAGKISFDYKDSAMDLSSVAKWLLAADPIAEVCASRALWGDAAARQVFVTAVRQAWHSLDLSFGNPMTSTVRLDWGVY